MKYRGYELLRIESHIHIIDKEGNTRKRVYTQSFKMAKKEIDKLIKRGVLNGLE